MPIHQLPEHGRVHHLKPVHLGVRHGRPVLRRVEDAIAQPGLPQLQAYLDPKMFRHFRHNPSHLGYLSPALDFSIFIIISGCPLLSDNNSKMCHTGDFFHVIFVNFENRTSWLLASVLFTPESVNL